MLPKKLSNLFSLSQEEKTSSDEAAETRRDSMELKKKMDELTNGLKKLNKQQNEKTYAICKSLDRVEIKMIEVEKELKGGTMKHVSGDDDRVSELRSQFEAMEADLEHMQHMEGEIEKIYERLDAIEARLSRIHKDVNTVRDGFMIWKIRNVGKFFGEEQKKKNLALFSDIIYTSKYGYKLQAVAYPNGIASGFGTHFSIYLTILKGEYDAILEWPFNKRVFFTMLDQNENVKEQLHRTEELICDRGSSSFTRPASETGNPGWGFPRFIAIDRLMPGNLIKDDCIFLQIEIEPSNENDY